MRWGGMPQMTFEWILKENGISKNDLTIDTSISFAATSGAFIGGLGDFVTLFELNDTKKKSQSSYLVPKILSPASPNPGTI